MSVIGVDIGGTSIRVGLFDTPGNSLETIRVPMRQWGWPLHVGALASMLNEHIKHWEVAYGEVRGIGFALAAVVDPALGYVHVAENLGWKDLPFGLEMSARLRRHIRVDGDAACGGLAEAQLGSGQGHTDFLYVVIGTGIGHALVLNNKVHHGMRNSANVFGHIKVVQNGAPCYCGGAGCLCQYASGEGLARLGQEASGRKNVTSHDVALAYAAGKQWAQIVVERWMDWLALPLANVLNLLDIDLIVLGGGVIQPDFPSLDALTQRVRTLTYPQIYPFEIRRAQLGESSVLAGAAQLVFTEETKEAQ